MLTSILYNRNPEQDVALVVGVEEEKRVFFLAKDPLMKIPFFKGALSANRFAEGRSNRVAFPEDDIYLWKKAVEFINTGEFYPRLVPATVQFSHNYPPPHETHGRRTIRDKWHVCMALEIPLHIMDQNEARGLFQHDGIRIGNWATTKATHSIFDQLVGLFCMAEEYGWTELMALCMRKIDIFPIGPRAFATLAANCASMEAGLLDPYKSPKASLLRLLEDVYEYHQAA